jgi:hypothetical protein
MFQPTEVPGRQAPFDAIAEPAADGWSSANELAELLDALAVEAGGRARPRHVARGEALGIPEAGRVAVGDPATFLLVQGDPLSDPSALWRVWLRAGGGSGPALPRD